MGCDCLLEGYVSIKSPDCLWWWRKYWIYRQCSDSYQSSKLIFVFKWHLRQETNPSICRSQFLLHFRCATFVEILNVFFPSSIAFWAGIASNTEFHFIFSLVQCTINYLERAFKLHNIPDRWARHATGKAVSPYNSSLCFHTTADYSFHAQQKWICAV